MKEFLNALPPHNGSLNLSHNGHKDCYETIEQWFAGDNYPEEDAWVSLEQRTKAIAEDSVWLLHVYPNTPIAFYLLAACDLDVLLAAAANA